MSIAIDTPYKVRLLYPGAPRDPHAGFYGLYPNAPDEWKMSVMVFSEHADDGELEEGDGPHHYIENRMTFTIEARDRESARSLAELAAKSALRRELNEYEAAELRRQWNYEPVFGAFVLSPFMAIGGFRNNPAK